MKLKQERSPGRLLLAFSASFALIIFLALSLLTVISGLLAGSL